MRLRWRLKRQPMRGNVISGRSFMCGALGEKKPIDEELAFARDLINAVVAGFPRERTAMHVCRGNWSPDVIIGDRPRFQIAK
jgi:methionine synthase II (cobalamin-independent)